MFNKEKTIIFSGERWLFSPRAISFRSAWLVDRRGENFLLSPVSYFEERTFVIILTDLTVFFSQIKTKIEQTKIFSFVQKKTLVLKTVRKRRFSRFSSVEFWRWQKVDFIYLCSISIVSQQDLSICKKRKKKHKSVILSTFLMRKTLPNPLNAHDASFLVVLLNAASLKSIGWFVERSSKKNEEISKFFLKMFAWWNEKQRRSEREAKRNYRICSIFRRTFDDDLIY